MKQSDISNAIFDALSLYCVENKFYDAVKGLTKENLEPVQTEVEILLKKLNIDVE